MAMNRNHDTARADHEHRSRRVMPSKKSLLKYLLGLSLSLSANAIDSRGIVRSGDGQEVLRYGKSYALLVGVSDYGWGSGWKDLDSIPGELDKVENALETVGFHGVVRVDNPDEEALREAFEKFKDDYGFKRNNRLLFFFSGHGYTDEDGAGYLVPRDAPDPREGESAFLKKALPMNQILSWARQIKARHALFLFDSCFSGTIFEAKSLPRVPPLITKLTARKVRQFITAGTAGEEVPARSTFTPAFVDALLHREGDLDRDGYVTGTELGLHLQSEVSRYAVQTPQFGKIDEYDLAQGDFVFVLGSGGPKPKVAVAQKVEKAAPPASRDMELAFWNTIEDSKDPDDYRAYLGQFPDGVFAGLARNRVGKLATSVGWAKSRSDVPITGSGSVGSGSVGSEPVGSESVGSESIGSKMGTAPGAFAHPTMLAPKGAGDKWTDPITGMEFVWVPGGCFEMGSDSSTYDDERPVHRVCVKGFQIGRTEVTQRQWRAVMGDNPSGFKGGNRPVEKVSWHDAQEFMKKLSARSGGSRCRLG
uniref:Caspase domain-containing protein n=1 Tax=Candidatus Kentrum sp. FW TaxID=2126338 RepID=A0A450TPN3_9GAMM|nr:MAG: Caspase domain-containing protein [Candidatus Kentron sp. FW]